ncbi:hypothetical protein DF122_22560 [Burkholderia pseudomallei]|nr:hypothetical protein [Burkholderia pseudomallei]MPT63069.1 hypothetical protein [Burkholderia pseudomallei]MPT70749.1 hypothetical protein [Burkholderia pseudomallei]MPT76572.1 hypothetical protein [Burkholderia pseudomallei]MPT84385.1 hypothetical protein [Burkholderia pseudomallei]
MLSDASGSSGRDARAFAKGVGRRVHRACRSVILHERAHDGSSTSNAMQRGGGFHVFDIRAREAADNMRRGAVSCIGGALESGVPCTLPNLALVKRERLG